MPWPPSVGFCSHFDNVPRIKTCELSIDYAFMLFSLLYTTFERYSRLCLRFQNLPFSIVSQRAVKLPTTVREQGLRYVDTLSNQILYNE